MNTVSIVMCTYNGEKFLQEQLESIVNQTYPIYELIIQDDCSDDRTLTIAEEYAKQYPYIHIHRNKQNLGFNRNFQEAISKAQGDLIAIADQDDIWYTDKIEKQAAIIGTHDLCITAYHRDKEFHPENMKKTIVPHYGIEYLLFYNSIPGHCMLLKRSFLQTVFDKWDGHILYDWWLSINAHLNNGIIRIDQPLNWHRPHKNSSITQLNARYASYVVSNPTWQPYWYGLKRYREQQKLPTWKFFYTYIYEHTSKQNFPLAHSLSKLLLQKDPISLFKLCWLCMRHKQKIYYYPNQKGFASYIRSFFYPMIRAYGNTYFKL